MVGRIGGAEIALGVDVEMRGLGDRGAEQALQMLPRDQLMLGVDAAQRRALALLVQHVADIVQERRGDERRRRALLLRERAHCRAWARCETISSRASPCASKRL